MSSQLSPASFSGGGGGGPETFEHGVPPQAGGCWDLFKSRRRRRRGTRKGSRKSRRGRKSRKMGGGMLEAAVVPAGLFALQRYFKGSRKSKKNFRKFGKSFKRTVRGGSDLSPATF